MIFVQIASYRDPELIPTVLDLVDKADHPEQLRIVVAWQHDDNESIEPIKHLIEYIDIPYVESKGVCWARNLIQQKYNGEEYTLQLDSHHRFIKGWDSILLQMYDDCKNLGSDKPLITGYLPHFNSLTDEYKNEIWQMNVEKFMDEGPLFFVPEPVSTLDVEINQPIPARFYSAHFAFSNGDFAKVIQHDPEYYFYGEETNITVRAYTHGYDLYHPNKLIAWHQYTRDNRPKHWDDHINTDKKTVKKEWWEMDNESTKKHRSLFGIDGESTTISKYGFGNERTVQDYEQYAGIRFADRYISEYTLKKLPPPNPL